jgi:hypothetical protein
MINRFPWVEPTTAKAFKERLAQMRGQLLITLKDGATAMALKYRSGVVYLDGAKKVPRAPSVLRRLANDGVAHRRRFGKCAALASWRVSGSAS